MNLKKILTGAVIGAFIFGISASSIQPVSAAQGKGQNPKFEEFDNNRNNDDKNSNGQNPPEPPKDSNGKPLPPPDKNNNSDRAR